MFRNIPGFTVAVAVGCSALAASAAQLSGDARAAIPHEVQQLVVVDYRAMQNSDAAMQLRDRVMPPDLKQFDDALRKSGINDNHDVDSLAFALYRVQGVRRSMETVGIAQGQFDVDDMVANFRKQKVRPTADPHQPRLSDGQDRDGAVLRRSLDHGLRQHRGREAGAGCARRIGAQPADQRSR